MEVWLWLWRERKYILEVTVSYFLNSWCGIYSGNSLLHVKGFKNDDPEAAIIAAIEHLVTNDLIK